MAIIVLLTVTFDNYLKASIIGGYKFEGFMDLARNNKAGYLIQRI